MSNQGTDTEQQASESDDRAVIDVATAQYVSATIDFINGLRECLDETGVLTVYASGFLTVLLAECGESRAEFLLRRMLSRVESGQFQRVMLQ